MFLLTDEELKPILREYNGFGLNVPDYYLSRSEFELAQKVAQAQLKKLVKFLREKPDIPGLQVAPGRYIKFVALLEKDWKELKAEAGLVDAD